MSNNEATKANIQDQIKNIFNQYAVGGYWLEISADDLDEVARRIESEIVDCCSLRSILECGGKV